MVFSGCSPWTPHFQLRELVRPRSPAVWCFTLLPETSWSSLAYGLKKLEEFAGLQASSNQLKMVGDYHHEVDTISLFSLTDDPVLPGLEDMLT